MAPGAKSARSGATGRVVKTQLRPKAEFDHLTHYLFRYPAKFHPPVARQLLDRFTSKGETVLDPFCGSGTLLVEAAVAGRNSVGVDVDPLAVLIARAKVHKFRAESLNESGERTLRLLSRYERSACEYERRKFQDLGKHAWREQSAALRSWIPEIPRLEHWFRRYVVVDLARIRKCLEQAKIPETHKAFFRVVFASIIRNSSNADPVPVSGLEVTSHMKERDEAGRLINPFELFRRSLRRAIAAAYDLADSYTDSRHKVIHGDATRLDESDLMKVDVVITSPPYHGAVDYYRRHQLEMYWLGLTKTHDDRLDLLQRYVGRPKVPRSHPFVLENPLKTALAKEWEARIREVTPERADAFHHYIVAMSRCFDCLARLLKPNQPAVLVVGHSSWNESEIPTTRLFQEVALDRFELEELLWYPLKNRYMSYGRWNNASIDKEFVLVFRRTRNVSTSSWRGSR